MNRLVALPGLLLFTCMVSAQPRPLNLIEGFYASGYDARSKPQQGGITYKHAASLPLGDNLFFMDISNLGNYKHDPNLYIEWAPRLSLGKSALGEQLSFGLVRDV